MSTRSGLLYHSETAGTMANREEGAGPMAVTMGDVLKFLAESQEKQAIEERRREQERERNFYVQARGDKLNWKDEVAGVRRQSKVTCFIVNLTQRTFKHVQSTIRPITCTAYECRIGCAPNSTAAAHF